MVGISEQFPEFHGRVRFDRETMKGSLRDTVRLMGFNNKNASRAIKSIEENYPELFARFHHMKINGAVSL